MKTRTVTVSEGEYLGPVDWSYDFASHFQTLCTTDEAFRSLYCLEHTERLRRLEAEPDHYLATTDGGSPKIGFREVLAVGMYDGWPYWRPVPSVQLAGVFGAEWHAFSTITEIREKTT